jgi:hypothetical protein
LDFPLRRRVPVLRREIPEEFQHGGLAFGEFVHMI